MSKLVQKSQVHKTTIMSQDDDKRLCLVDDLKEAQVHIQVKLYGTSSSLKSMITTTYHKMKLDKQNPMEIPWTKAHSRPNIFYNLTYAPSIITSQKPTERELELLFEAMYHDYIGGQPSDTPRTAPAALVPQGLQTPTTSTTTDVDEPQQQQHDQQQDDQAQLQSEAVADNVPNAMFDENTFVNPFAPPSISSTESLSQYVDSSNMHTFYQPCDTPKIRYAAGYIFWGVTLQYSSRVATSLSKTT
ncbi:hypothetical protein Tco_1265461 [Tanacetum coccineum]